MDCDVWNFIWNYTTTCTDLTNLATMKIEIFIGVIGAISITWFFYRRESNRKKSRGKTISKMIVRNSIISLRYHLREFIKLLINETKTGRSTNPEKLNETWKILQEWRPKIAPLFAISGDVISAEQQVVLGRILEYLEKDFDFKEIEWDQAEMHGLDGQLTRYLQMNKDIVIEEFNETKLAAEERISKIPDPNSNTGKIWKENILRGIKENEEIVKDIIDD